VSGAIPRLRTAVRVGVRNDVLLVRFDGRDDGMVASLRRRDEPLWTEDVYEVFLSPLDPPTTYFELEINPLGAIFDARVTSPDLLRTTMHVDPAWKLAGLRSSSRVKPGRWTATLKIPLAPLFEGATRPREWRANFYRVDRGDRDEFSAWSPTGRNPPDFHEALRFGRMTLPV
jgi:Carbohydrate-binding family 9